MAKYTILIIVIAGLTLGGMKLEAKQKISLDENKMILIDGKSFFPIGSYYLPKSEEPYVELAEAGFNLIRCGFSKEQLDIAHAHGLKTWVSLGGGLDLSADREKRKDEIKRKLDEFSGHPSILAWESIDEPAWTWKKPWKQRTSAEGLAEGHALVKKIDPAHLLWINHAPRNTVNTLRKFSQKTDIVACDIYPVIARDIDAEKTYAIIPGGKHGDLANQTISCVGEYVDKMRRVANNDKAVWMVLQGFAWDHDKKGENALYPTFEQTRFMAYNAIIHGVNGILYWGTSYMPQPSPWWDGIKRVVGELSTLQPVLTSPPIKHNISQDYAEMGFSTDAGVEIMLKEYDNKKYLFAANTTIGKAKVIFSNLPNFTGQALQVLFEDREVSLSKGIFEDTFEPYEVHVYSY